MTLDEQLEILQAAKRGEIIYAQLAVYKIGGQQDSTWFPIQNAKTHEFNFHDYNYRIADQYAELKAAAQDPTKQIRIRDARWEDAGYAWSWGLEVNDYEIRDKPKKKVVKYLCYDFYGKLIWVTKIESVTLDEWEWYRRPAFDKECEVEDE